MTRLTNATSTARGITESQDTDSQLIHRTQRKTKIKICCQFVEPSVAVYIVSVFIRSASVGGPSVAVETNDISSEFPQQMLCTAALGTLTNAYSD